MEVLADAGKVTPEQVRDLVERFNAGRVLPSEKGLLELVQVHAFVAYRRKWPKRGPVIELVLQGVRPSTAAQGICDESTAREWTRHFWRAAAASLVHLAKQDARQRHSRDILKSLCAFLHPKTCGGGRMSVRANMCPGCSGG